MISRHSVRALIDRQVYSETAYTLRTLVREFNEKVGLDFQPMLDEQIGFQGEKLVLKAAE